MSAIANRKAGQDLVMTWKSAKPVPRTKSLPDDVNEAGREALRSLIAARWDGKEARAARAIGVSKATLNLYLGGGRGGGAKLAASVMKVDVTVGLIMLGAEVPLLRPAPWVAEVASRLVRDGFPNDAVAWAIIQALHFGRGRDSGDLLEAARVLAAIRVSVAAPQNARTA